MSSITIRLEGGRRRPPHEDFLLPITDKLEPIGINLYKSRRQETNLC